jgi:two-component sensor histidine kinase
VGLKLAHRVPLLMFAAMLPLVFVLFFNLYWLQSSKEREAHAEAFRAGQLVALEFRRILTGMENVLGTMASSPSVQQFDTERCVAFLASAAKRLPGVATIGVIDLDGKIRCRQSPEGIGTNLKDRPFFQDALHTGTFVVGDYTQSRITGKSLLPMAMPMTSDDGKVIGVVALSMDLEWLQRILMQRTFAKDANVTVADRNGVILARYPFPERFVGKRIPDAYLHLVTAGDPGTLELTSQDGTRRILAYFPVTDTKGLYVSTGLSVADTFSAIRRATEFGLATTLFAIVLASFLSWQSTHYAIQRPVQKILRALTAWHGRDTRARTGMQATAGEFGTIGAAVDVFMNELATAEEQRALLIGELDHRVKNVLATVQSVAMQTFRGDNRNSEAVTIFNERLRAIANSFDLLSRGTWQAAAFLPLVKRAVSPFSQDDRSQITINGPDFPIKARAALAFSMALHELCTNASKYGALTTPDGRIIISWQLEQATQPALEFFWEERGGPKVTPPQRSGFGSVLIEKALTSQLEAEVRLDYLPTGLKCFMRVPQSSLVPDPEGNEPGSSTLRERPEESAGAFEPPDDRAAGIGQLG